MKSLAVKAYNIGAEISGILVLSPALTEAVLEAREKAERLLEPVVVDFSGEEKLPTLPADFVDTGVLSYLLEHNSDLPPNLKSFGEKLLSLADSDKSHSTISTDFPPSNYIRVLASYLDEDAYTLATKTLYSFGVVFPPGAKTGVAQFRGAFLPYRWHIDPLVVYVDL